MAKTKLVKKLNKVPTGISLDPTIVEPGKQRARTMGLSFASYIEQLIRRDCGMNSAFGSKAA